jgi:hypothetical protein
VVGDRVVVRRDLDAGSNWEADGVGGVGSCCVSDLRARRRLLQVDGGGKVGVVLVRQVDVGSCRSCFFAGFGPLVGGYSDGVLCVCVPSVFVVCCFVFFACLRCWRTWYVYVEGGGER